VGLIPVGPGAEGSDAAPIVDDEAELRTIATSPAVGVYQPRPDARPGTRVQAGDRLGVVDMLGVPQEVVAPIDGIVGISLVEPGQAVEYGQELVVIDPPDNDGPAGPGQRPNREA
jgi:acetyl-CoA carboxylase biotin carboxyl carrier protein